MQHEIVPLSMGKRHLVQSKVLDELHYVIIARQAGITLRRMLSNRESARRSRRRKQEHLSQLEDEVHAATVTSMKSIACKTQKGIMRGNGSSYHSLWHNMHVDSNEQLNFNRRLQGF